MNEVRPRPDEYVGPGTEERECKSGHVDTPALTLNDGHEIPQLGFGVFQIPPAETAHAVREALAVGYRHIDTAQMYGNEGGVGQAVGESGLDRSEVFITSKLNNDNHRRADARRSFAETLELLGTDHVDLFLIHWPLPTRYDGDFVSTWQALVELRDEGRVRSIGVSNFQPAHLDRLAAASGVLPAVNQIEVHPFFGNRAVRAVSAAAGILTEAWSPIAKGQVAQDATIHEIAASLGRTPAQVTLRWHLQHGHIVFPKTTRAERMRENADVFDFALSADDMATIDGLDRGAEGRLGPDPDTFDRIG